MAAVVVAVPEAGEDAVWAIKAFNSAASWASPLPPWWWWWCAPWAGGEPAALTVAVAAPALATTGDVAAELVEDVVITAELCACNESNKFRSNASKA